MRVARWFRWCFVAMGAVAASSCARAVARDDFMPGSPGGTGSGSGSDQGPGLVIDSDAGGSLLVQPMIGSSVCSSARACDPTCTDFPATPILDQAPQNGASPTPQDAASHFQTAATAAGGPCIVEPGDGALLPNNWVRPRFRFLPADPTETLFEIRIATPRQQNDLVVYTTSSTWTMPKSIWQAIAASTWDEDLTVTVLAVDPTKSASQPVSSQMKFRIAPAPANGSMVYWAAVGDQNGDSWLEGFSVGDETVATVLTPSQVVENMSRDTGGNLQAQTQCIGCHAAAPDQKSVTFLDFYPWPGVAADVDPMHTGQVPTWLTPGGAEALSQPWLGMMTFSSATWNTGAHIVIAGYQVPAGSVPWEGSWSAAPDARLAWIDLSTSAPPVLSTDAGALKSLDQTQIQALTANQGTSYGFLARNGDPLGAACPSWSHDGETVVYVSTNAAKDGRLAQGTADLYTVPYNGNAGGDAKPLEGASDPTFAEYYPWFSPDDKYIAFDRAPVSENMYYNPHAEVFVVPAAGGTAVRLAANDPPACTSASSPGVTNGWPKWAPQAPTCSGKTYYWVIFSSTRAGQPFNGGNFKAGLLYPNEPTSQLYLTAVVDDGTGALTTYPGVYVWNQPSTSTISPGSNQSNHTPLWDVVSIPPSPPPR
jgi:hypothetical protein